MRHSSALPTPLSPPPWTCLLSCCAGWPSAVSMPLYWRLITCVGWFFPLVTQFSTSATRRCGRGRGECSVLCWWWGGWVGGVWSMIYSLWMFCGKQYAYCEFVGVTLILLSPPALWGTQTGSCFWSPVRRAFGRAPRGACWLRTVFWLVLSELVVWRPEPRSKKGARTKEGRYRSVWFNRGNVNWHLYTIESEY